MYKEKEYGVMWRSAFKQALSETVNDCKGSVEDEALRAEGAHPFDVLNAYVSQHIKVVEKF